jgi:large subunit ribosomal protein L15
VEKYDLTDINPESLFAKRLIKRNDKIKILGRGELNSSVTVTSHAVSASAKQAIEEKGGSVNLIGA